MVKNVKQTTTINFIKIRSSVVPNRTIRRVRYVERHSAKDGKGKNPRNPIKPSTRIVTRPETVPNVVRLREVSPINYNSNPTSKNYFHLSKPF